MNSMIQLENSGIESRELFLQSPPTYMFTGILVTLLYYTKVHQSESMT